MGRSSSFGVSGFRELDRKLARVQAVPGQRKAVTGHLRRGANVIAAEERRLIPVRSGATRRSIRVTTQPGFVLEGAGPRDVSIFIGPQSSGWRATFLEWGTINSAAHPFARPAVDTKGEEAVGVVLAGLRNLIEAASR